MPTTQRPTLALLLAAFSICACRRETDLPTREPAHAQPVAPACPDPADSQPVTPKPPDPTPATEPSTRFTIHPPDTVVWSVIDGQCVRLHFVPSREESGIMMVGGPSVQYELVGDQIELFDFSKRKGEGHAHWSCWTALQLGEDGRLGQADLFADRADCEAGQATAAPLDGSDELIARKCSGEQLAVDTEVQCGPNMRYAVHTPGCISLIANDSAFRTPTPPSRAPSPGGPNQTKKTK